MEMDISMICACLLTFPSFLDRFGPGFISRIRSFGTLRRATSRDTSGIRLQDSGERRTVKTSLGSSRERINPADEDFPVYTVTPTEQHNRSYRAQLEHLDQDRF